MWLGNYTQQRGEGGANNEANARKEILFVKVSRMGIKGERL